MNNTNDKATRIIHCKLRDRVCYQTYDQIRRQVSAQVWYQVYQVQMQVYDQVRTQVGNQVWQQLKELYENN